MRSSLQWGPGRWWLWLLLAVGMWAPEAGAAFKYLHEGMPVPRFQGTDLLSGAEVSSEQLGEGKVLVVVFWATWSRRSIQELADLARLAARFEGDPVAFLAVNVEGQDLARSEQERIRSLVDSLAPPFPVLVDDGLEIFYRFGVIAVPSTAIVDTTGIMRFGPAGYSLATRDFIVDSIEVLLGRHAPTVSRMARRGYVPQPAASRYYQLAVTLSHQRMYERAMEHLERAVATDSGFAAPFALRGDIYVRTGAYDSAVVAYREALARDSLSIQALSGLGEALLRAGRIDSSLAVLARAVALDSTYTPALLARGMALATVERFSEAIAVLQQARELNPRDPRIVYSLARVARRQGDLPRAVEWYQEALALWYPSP